VNAAARQHLTRLLDGILALAAEPRRDVAVGDPRCAPKLIVTIGEDGRILARRAPTPGDLAASWALWIGDAYALHATSAYYDARTNVARPGSGWRIIPFGVALTLCPPHGIRREVERGGPRTGGSWFEAHETRGYAHYETPAESSDHALMSAMDGAYGQGPGAQRAAAAEWLRRYPSAASGSGWKIWKRSGDLRAARLAPAARTEAA
jgi:hypothetical protein